eukprot:Rmarinus@m.5552
MVVRLTWQGVDARMLAGARGCGCMALAAVIIVGTRIRNMSTTVTPRCVRSSCRLVSSATKTRPSRLRNLILSGLWRYTSTLRTVLRRRTSSSRSAPTTTTTTYPVRRPHFLFLGLSLCVRALFYLPSCTISVRDAMTLVHVRCIACLRVPYPHDSSARALYCMPSCTISA